MNEVVGEVKKPLYILMGAVGCLLLIACLNLSNLLVARAAARRREIAIRTALGSSRARLCREQLTESLLICVAGGALGMVLAVWATRWLTTRWVDMPRAEAVHPDGVVVAFAVGITLRHREFFPGCCLRYRQPDAACSPRLQDASRTIGGSASRASLRKTLLTAEIALTVVLLVCAGLSVQELSAVALGGPGMPDRQRADHEVFSFAGQSMTSRSRSSLFIPNCSRRCVRFPGWRRPG